MVLHRKEEHYLVYILNKNHSDSCLKLDCKSNQE